jgi:hypothetical protein
LISGAIYQIWKAPPAAAAFPSLRILFECPTSITMVTSQKASHWRSCPGTVINPCNQAQNGNTKREIPVTKHSSHRTLSGDRPAQMRRVFL